MTESGERALLPPGMNDLLPPDAAFEAATVESLIAAFAAQGYERVKPPLLEFEETLLSGAGASMGGQTFRLMDPISQRMLALRADMTLQIARIATTRLGHVARPLRLCYAGQVLQVSGSQLRSQRQVGQVGCELIGGHGAAADGEIITLAAQSLTGIGVRGLSVDLNLPPLVPVICQDYGLDAAQIAALRAALDRKDAAGVAALGGPAAKLLGTLLAAAGPARKALAVLSSLELPAIAAQDVARLRDVVALVETVAPDLKITIDPVENRGFEYHTGVSFVLFALGVRGERRRAFDRLHLVHGHGASGCSRSKAGTSAVLTLWGVRGRGPSAARRRLGHRGRPDAARRRTGCGCHGGGAPPQLHPCSLGWQNRQPHLG